MESWHKFAELVPLDDERDILARIGFRFAWLTGPMLLMAFAFSLFGKTRPLLGWWTFVVLCIPYIGGIVDWRRLQRHTKSDIGKLQ